MISFATDKPIGYDYDPDSDALYVRFLLAPVVRSVELLAEWPLVVLDVDGQDQIIGIEFVGFKQFGPEGFTALLGKQIWQSFGRIPSFVLSPSLADQFSSYLRSPEAIKALLN